MKNNQYEILIKPSKIKIGELENLSDRTLLFGTWKNFDILINYHLYIDGEMFHLTISESKNNQRKDGEIKSFKFRDELINFIPNLNDLTFKPECCDFEFCTLLKSKGIILNFDDFDNDKSTKKFYGVLYENLKKN